jgi:hypothetical protein
MDTGLLEFREPGEVAGHAGRSSLPWASLATKAAFSCSTTPGPARRTSLTRVVGCGTGRSRPMRQNRRQPSESLTSRHKLS